MLNELLKERVPNFTKNIDIKTIFRDTLNYLDSNHNLRDVANLFQPRDQ